MTHAYSLGKRFAISIGINTHPLDPTAPLLLHAESDARAFDTYLMESEIPRTQRALLIGQQATRAAIYTTLERLLSHDPGKQDTVIFYYAGYALPWTKRILGDVGDAGHVRLDALLAAADLNSLVLDNPDDLPLPGMHTLRHQFIDISRSQHQLFMLDCYYSTTMTLDEKDWMSERMRQLMQQDFPGRGSLVNWTSAQDDNDPQFSTHRFAFSLLEAARGALPQALRHASLTAQSLHTYICAHQHDADRQPELSYTSQADLIIIPCSKKTEPIPLTNNADKPQGSAVAQQDKHAIPFGLVPPPALDDVSGTVPSNQLQAERVKSLQEDLPVAHARKQTISLPREDEGPAQAGPINVFICYSKSREDEKFLEKLQTHLHPLAMRGVITYWDRTQIKPGLKWRAEIEQAMASAQVAILLVSADLFQQDMHDELSQLLQRAEDGSMTLIPISVRDVLLDGTRLQKFKFLNEQPLNDMKASQRDRIWTQAVSTIMHLR